ncbi:MAG: hypothetical protein KDC90_13875 [Ignavibacteriae bacterium]|nr:hypothetical protein [Ignavibacteriota bacterium]
MFNRCELLDSILNNNVLKKVIGIENATSNRPSIRFINTKANDFDGCEIMHFFQNISLPVEGFVIPQPTYSLNTGQFRDIVLLEYKIHNDTINLNLVAAHFYNQLEKEGIPYFEFQFVINKDGKLLNNKVNVKYIKESRRSIDYDKF